MEGWSYFLTPSDLLSCVNYSVRKHYFAGCVHLINTLEWIFRTRSCENISECFRVLKVYSCSHLIRRLKNPMFSNISKVQPDAYANFYSNSFTNDCVKLYFPVNVAKQRVIC